MSEQSTHSARGVFRIFLLWAVVYVASQMAGIVALLLTGADINDGDTFPTWVLAVSVSGMWAMYLVVSPRLLPFEDTPIQRAWPQWFQWRDVIIGIPAGIGGQLVLVNLVNWPLSKFFPDTFSFDEVSQRAEDLVAASPGAWIILLAVIVVLGAPIVEEIVYRGSVQTGFVQNGGVVVGVLLTAALFAAIHQSPVEFPGLFVFALLLGILRQRSGTLGAPIIAHMAFNATGLALVSLF